MSQFPTSQENIALDIIFGLLGESRFNRTMDEYMAVASRAPKFKVLHADVNKVLREMADAGYAPFEICYFKKGDQYPWYEKFPTSLSKETVRKAWVKSGMRQLQIEHRRIKAKLKRSH
jgi:hypothetical protein